MMLEAFKDNLVLTFHVLCSFKTFWFWCILCPCLLTICQCWNIHKLPLFLWTLL